MRGYTERGLLWVALSLSLALGGGVVSLPFLLGATSRVLPPRTFFLIEDLTGLVTIALALLGFWRLRQGRAEHGAAHTSSLRRGTAALLLAVISEMLVLGTGVLLGYGFPPAHAILVTGTYPPQLTAEWLLLTLHSAGYILISVFAGLFLLWMMWGLVKGVPRGIALVAFVFGIPTSVISLVLIADLVEPGSFPVLLVYVSWVLPALSVSQWLAAYLLAMRRVRSVDPVAATSHEASELGSQ